MQRYDHLCQIQIGQVHVGHGENFLA